MKALNGAWEVPPGGVTVANDRQGTTWFTPHTAECKGPAYTRLEEFALGIQIDASRSREAEPPKEGHTA